MKPALPPEHKSTILLGMLALVLFLVVLQLWLLTATLNAWLGGDQAVLLPAGLTSVLCLLGNLVLVRAARSLD